MSNMVKWGILGAAGIARKSVVPAILQSKNAEVVAVASSTLNKAHEFADQFNISKRYANYEELLNDEEIQAVYIPLPNSLHATWVKKAAEKGKHILCEKPAAITVEEVKSMVDTCKENKVVFMEAFMYQFHPQHVRVKEIIASGEIGTVNLMRSSFSFYLDAEANNIRLSGELGGGSLYDVGCYCIHSSRYLLEKEPKEVFASSNLSSSSGVDLTTVGVLSFEDGVKASFDCSFQQPFENKYVIVGTKGKIEVPTAYRPDINNGDGEIVITVHDEVRKEVLTGDQYTLQIEHFSECILNEQTPIYSGDETIKNMIVLEACLKSLTNHTPIVLE